MKYLLFILALAGCARPSDETQTQIPVDAKSTTGDPTAQGTFEGVPPDATREAFPDMPELTRVHTRQGTGYGEWGTYRNGVREGSWIEYHPNGVVKSITPYVNGKVEGLRVELSTNGVLEKRCMYHNNMRHGDYEEFNYASVKERRTYVNDKLEGQVKIFYPNGVLMEESYYKNGTRDGISRWFDRVGDLTIEYEYKNGELVKK